MTAKWQSQTCRSREHQHLLLAPRCAVDAQVMGVAAELRRQAEPCRAPHGSVAVRRQQGPADLTRHTLVLRQSSRLHPSGPGPLSAGLGGLDRCCHWALQLRLQLHALLQLQLQRLHAAWPCLHLGSLHRSACEAASRQEWQPPLSHETADWAVTRDSGASSQRIGFSRATLATSVRRRGCQEARRRNRACDEVPRCGFAFGFYGAPLLRR